VLIVKIQEAKSDKASKTNMVRIVKKQEAQSSKPTSIEALEAASMVRVTSLQKGVKSSNGLVAKQGAGTKQGRGQKNSPAADEYTVRYANLTATQTSVSSVGFSFFGTN
jgi:hypothetical protein